MEVQKTSPSRRTITVTVPADELEKAYSQAFEERRKALRLKGFRKGNVPAKIARKHITDAHLTRRAANLVVPSAYREALKQSGIQPLGKPDWRLKQSDRGSDLIFEATIQVMPILEINDYKGTKIERPEIRIEAHRVEEILDRRRQGVARYADRPADHSAVLGDFCFIDYSATHKEVPLPHAQVSNFLLEMREDKFLPGFVNKLVGTAAGEEVEFILRLPENYAHQQLAGEEVTFRVKVHQIKERQVPALDDDFARQHCQAESLEALRRRVSQNLLNQQRKLVEEEIVNEIVSRLVSQIDLNIVPAQLQEGHARLALRTQTQTLERQGTTIEKWLAGRGITTEHFSEELNLTGLVEARLEIFYRSLAAAENVVITNREVDQAIVSQAKSLKVPVRELKKKMLDQDTYKLLAYRLLIGKLRKRLLELADITYLAPSKSSDTSKKTPQSKAKSSAKKKSKSKKKSVAKAKPGSTKKQASKKKKPKAKTRAKKRSNKARSQTTRKKK